MVATDKTVKISHHPLSWLEKKNSISWLAGLRWFKPVHSWFSILVLATSLAGQARRPT